MTYNTILYPLPHSDVDDIDLFAGGISEKSLPDGQVGPTFACIIGRTFQALRQGDRFWYENDNDAGFTPGSCCSCNEGFIYIYIYIYMTMIVIFFLDLPPNSYINYATTSIKCMYVYRFSTFRNACIIIWFHIVVY